MRFSFAANRVNLSANADAQRRLAAARPTLSGRRLLLRYMALALHV
jgi:hypothetical protein